MNVANDQIALEITENMRQVLKKEGIRFDKAFFDEKNMPSSALPFGRIIYRGEAFEHSHGQKPGFAELKYLIKVHLADRDQDEAMNESQKWVHRLRGALTIDALNTGSLAQIKSVSRVDFRNAAVSSGKNSMDVECDLAVRYRES